MSCSAEGHGGVGRVASGGDRRRAGGDLGPAVERRRIGLLDDGAGRRLDHPARVDVAALAPDDDADAVPGRDHVSAAGAGAGGIGGVGVQRRGLQRPLSLEVVGGSHVPAAGAARVGEGQVRLAEVRDRYGRARGAAEQSRGRAQRRGRGGRLVDVERPAVDEGQQQQPARPRRDHGLGGGAQEAGVGLDRRRERASGQARHEHVGDAQDVLEVDERAGAVPGHRHAVQGLDAGAGPIDDRVVGGQGGAARTGRRPRARTRPRRRAQTGTGRPAPCATPRCREMNGPRG